MTEAKELIVGLIDEDLKVTNSSVVLDATSPDGDPGKFLLAGKPARAIHHFDGWFVPIELSWFENSFVQPKINSQEFYWYAFAIPRRSRYLKDHYFICDYLQMREWVLSFAAPLGNNHRSHKNWRADLRLYQDANFERNGYFRWGDEPPGADNLPGRVFSTDNISSIEIPGIVSKYSGIFGSGGESAAHKCLKLYVADHPTEFGLSSNARPNVEYAFPTGDRVDVMFENHSPDRTVVEVEVEGEDNVCVGIQQAIKYRALAAVDASYPLFTQRVRSLVVAYSVDYPKARDLSERYEVELASVDMDLVLSRAI